MKLLVVVNYKLNLILWLLKTNEAIRPGSKMLLRHLIRTYSTSRLRNASVPSKDGMKRWAIACAGGTIGCFFYYNSYYLPGQLRQNELSPDHFTRYRISYKQDVDQAHFLLELTPVAEQKINLWSKMGCEKLWSVEIKQPDVMVVRNYTPLPLQVNPETEQLEVFEDDKFAGGKLFFYIKQYEQGEVARWLHSLPENHIVELRGPYVDYEFPHYEGEVRRDRRFLQSGSKDPDAQEKFKYQQFDIAMFTAGTGIVTALQLLLTENPFRGSMDLFYSCKSFDELGPLGSIVDLLENNDRVRVHLTESSKQPCTEKRLHEISKCILKPSIYPGLVPYNGKSDHELKPVLSLVCGPEGYIAAISGPKYDLTQGPIGGLLENKQWNNDNVYKLT